MTRHLPAIRGRDLLKAVQRAGFSVVRVKGSHHVVRHPDGRTTVIPVHAGEAIGPGLLRHILRDIEFDKEKLREFL